MTTSVKTCIKCGVGFWPRNTNDGDPCPPMSRASKLGLLIFPALIKEIQMFTVKLPTETVARLKESLSSLASNASAIHDLLEESMSETDEDFKFAGERGPTTPYKLDEVDVYLMRSRNEMRMEDVRTGQSNLPNYQLVKELADEYGVSTDTVHDVLRYRSWRHVTGEWNPSYCKIHSGRSRDELIKKMFF